MTLPSSPRGLDCAGKVLDLSRPCIMGIVNVTPDSFSDGGQFIDPDAAVAHARRLVAEGADIVDIGGESTRPGAAPVDADAEIRRVIPVVERLAAELPVPISVDTGKPEVIRAAAAAGAGMINDVYALRAPGALEAAAETGLPVCVMHMQGEPRTMQQNPQYDDVVAEVAAFLADRAAACVAAGIGRERIVIDPGFGFGKTLRHNYQLLARLPELARLDWPVLVGMSRKSMIAGVLDAGEDRTVASATAAALAVLRGAAIVRVHDVAATAVALSVATAVQAPDRIRTED
ncbi:MAG TPA: dihydropteroate synthase [Gammaproteobacteria bacterium]|nr:dihydropteroate synthase [Gammaproteobacteria bacterium]